MIGVIALAGAGVGAGVAIVWHALRARPAPLVSVLAGLDPTADRDTTALARARRWAARVVPVSVDDATLRVVGRTRADHATARVVSAAAGGAAAVVLVGLAATVGFSLAGPLVAVLIAAGVAFGFVLPSVSVRDEAAARRRAFRHALSSYLDLVNVILAGGGGIESSLHAAAHAGEGWSFAALRDALDRARLRGESPWDAFGQLGRDLGVDELCELAASVSLAGSHGARIRGSLAAKADAMRTHQLADIEAQAESATERMTIPVAVLLFGFLVFIAYPALVQITNVTASSP